jgi:peptidoglycan/LPS O-acetylase OafA/YrhL
MGSLRFLLAFAVVVMHLKPFGDTILLDGQAAVQGFYMISGFYMALVLSEKYASKPVSVFYISRLARIFPVYYLVLALSALVAWYALVKFNSHPFSQFKNYPVSAGAEIGYVISQISLVGMDFWAFLRRTVEGGLVWNSAGLEALEPYRGRPIDYLLVGVAWSLSIELYFYAIAPFVAGKWRLIGGLCLVSFLVRIVGYRLGLDHAPFDYKFFPFELGLFMLGMLAFRAYRYLSDSNFINGDAVAVVIIIVLAGYTYFFPILPSTSMTKGIDLKHWLWIALLFLSIPVLFERTRRSSLDRLIGEFSYPMYLSHLLVASFIHFVLGVEFSARFALMSIAGTLLFCGVLIPLQEYIDKLRERLVSIKHEVKRNATVGLETHDVVS